MLSHDRWWHYQHLLLRRSVLSRWSSQFTRRVLLLLDEHVAQSLGRKDCRVHCKFVGAFLLLQFGLLLAGQAWVRHLVRGLLYRAAITQDQLLNLFDRDGVLTLRLFLVFGFRV